MPLVGKRSPAFLTVRSDEMRRYQLAGDNILAPPGFHQVLQQDTDIGEFALLGRADLDPVRASLVLMGAAADGDPDLALRMPQPAIAAASARTRDSSAIFNTGRAPGNGSAAENELAASGFEGFFLSEE